MKRLIPKLLLKTKLIGKYTRLILVATHQFNRCIEIGDPVSQAKIYEAQMADELILIDLDAGMGVRQEFIETLRKAAEQIFMPFLVGGGVKTLADFRILLANGADKISINSAAIENPDLITQASKMYGSQCVVVSIDYRTESNGENYVWTQGGKIKTTWSPLAWAIEAERRGAGEILLTAIDRDGIGAGLDLELVNKMVERLSIPVVISGGCGLAAHFIDGFRTGVSAVAASTFFCFKDQNLMQTRAHLKNANIPIRMQN